MVIWVRPSDPFPVSSVYVSLSTAGRLITVNTICYWSVLYLLMPWRHVPPGISRYNSDFSIHPRESCMNRVLSRFVRSDTCTSWVAVVLWISHIRIRIFIWAISTKFVPLLQISCFHWGCILVIYCNCPTSSTANSSSSSLKISLYLWHMHHTRCQYVRRIILVVVSTRYWNTWWYICLYF